MGETEAEFPTRWALAVCRYCGRQAVWPFCEHGKRLRETGGDWFTTITVKGYVPADRRNRDE
jgi:hypothetical protein